MDLECELLPVCRSCGNTDLLPILSLGNILLAEQLAERPELKGQAFNFSNEIQVTVIQIVKKILDLMDSTLEPELRNEVNNEIRHQYLSAEKARQILGWSPLYTLDQALIKTIDWYKEFLAHPLPTGERMKNDSIDN